MSQGLPGRGGSRRPPPNVAPLEMNGVRYEQARSGIPLDATDPSGWLRATEIATGAEIWLVQVYTNPDSAGDPSLPGGGRSVVYMVAIEAKGDQIVVTDTLGRSFVVDPETGASRSAG